MTRVHDMGGRHGDGPVPDKDDAEVFHTEWEARALALTVLAASHGAWNLDVSRHARERLSPKDYVRFSYYEKWLAGLADLLVTRKLVKPQELRDAHVDQPAPLADRTLRAADIPASQRKVVAYTRKISAAARFAPGDRVHTLSHASNTRVPGGHSRLPRYAMGREGRVVACHGAHVLPDSNAHGLGEAPEPLYAVAFAAEELWGTEAERPGDEMVLDLWESYLRPVSP